MNVLLLAGLLGLGLSACSKHECELEGDAQKQTLGKIADMTEGAVRCRVDGASNINGLVMQNLTCTIGKKDCIPLMEAIHGDGATVTSVVGGYKAWLKANKWELTKDEATESKAVNGNTLNGHVLNASRGDNKVIIRVFPFGDKLVQTRTLFVDKDA